MLAQQTFIQLSANPIYLWYMGCKSVNILVASSPLGAQVCALWCQPNFCTMLMTGNTEVALISLPSLFPVANWLHQTNKTGWQFNRDGGKHSSGFNDLIQGGSSKEHCVLSPSLLCNQGSQHSRGFECRCRAPGIPGASCVSFLHSPFGSAGKPAWPQLELLVSQTQP